MSFWKFGFASTSSIDTLLNAVPSTQPSTPSNDLGTQHDKSVALLVTFEQLLNEDDLLQECKTGHAKLADFLSRPIILMKMLEYINGSAFDFEIPEIAEEIEKDAVKRQRLPHVCTELLLCNNHLVMQELFSDSNHYLVPFWNFILDRNSQDALEWTSQLSFWAKTNSHFLNEKPVEMLEFVKKQPRLIERMVKHINAPPIADILFRIMQLELDPKGSGIIDWLSQQHLIDLLVARLSPSYSAMTHLSVTEFIKALINYCSTANANAGNSEFAQATVNVPQLGLPQTAWGKATQNQPQNGSTDDAPPVWASTALLRDLASERIISKMLNFMFDQTPSSTYVSEQDIDLITPRKEKTQDEALPGLQTASQGAETPRESSVFERPIASTSKAILLPTTFPTTDADDSKQTAENITSSLVFCISIIIDLIRKINSDFSEQQVLHYLRKRQDSSEAGSKALAQQQGPSVVDLSQMIRLIGGRVKDFNALLLHPRSKIEPLQTAHGPINPLTIERFRICEMYAELLHCSNMGLLNRQGFRIPRYDADGALVGGVKNLEMLEAALATPRHEIDPDNATETDAPQASFSNPSSSEESLADTAVGSAATSTYETPNISDTSSISLAMADMSIESTDDALAPVNSPIQLRSSQLSRKTTGDDLIDSSIASNMTAGQSLKAQFLEHNVHSVLLDLFFDYPWHNFLHNVVYDLIQQTFNARMDLPLNKDLCLSLFLKSNLTDRILKGQKANDLYSSGVKQRRLGYMGHLSLIAEETVKLFTHYQQETYFTILNPQQRDNWDAYVFSELRETRESDMQQLGGGIASIPHDRASTTSGMSDEDDEFPMSARAVKSRSSSEGSLGSQQVESSSPPATKGLFGPTSSNDQFAQYLASQMSNTAHDKFSSSSDEDDEDNVADWINSSGFDPKDADFQLRDDDDFGEFATAPPPINTSKEPFATKSNLTAADWNSDFKANFNFSAEDSSSGDDPFADSANVVSDGEEWGAFTSSQHFSEQPNFQFSPSDKTAFEDSFSPTEGDPPLFSPTLSTSSGHSQPYDDVLADVSSPKEMIRPDGLVEIAVDGQKDPVIVPADEVVRAKERSQSMSHHPVLQLDAA